MLQIAAISLALVCMVIVPLKAQQFEMEGKRKKEVINFIQAKNLIIVPVYINNSGPFNFLIDTGVGQMIITDTTFLKTINKDHAKTIQIQGYGFGKEIEAVLTRSITAKVGRTTMVNIPAAIFKEDVFDLSSYLGLRIHGILGYHFFNSFIVKVNYANSKLTLYRRSSGMHIKGTKVPMRIINAKPYIQAKLDLGEQKNIDVTLLVDNGSSHPLMLEAFENRAFPLPGITITANLGVGVNGEINGYMGRISGIHLGGYTFDNILAGFPDYHNERSTIEGVDRNGSIGAELLKHFTVTFDYTNGLLYLKKSNHFRKVFEHDMSGLEIYVRQAPHNRYFISRIEPGSPASLAGLREDDEIIAIDFRDMQAYDLNSITEIFRDTDGRQLLLEIQRKDERLAVILRLKKRI